MMSKLTHTSLLLSLCISSLATLSCLGTEVGNPEDASVSVQFEGVSQVASALSLSNGVTIDEVWISVGDFELWTSSPQNNSCGGPKLSLSQSTTFAELISAVEQPALLSEGVDISQYCRAKLKLKLPKSKEVLPQGVPEPLRDYTILIRGHREDLVPFELRVKEQSVIKFESSQEEALTRSRNDLLISFELAQWFDAEALAKLLPGENGLILIDKAEQGAFVRDFTKRFKRSARLIKDKNADGHLQLEEPLIAVGVEDEEEAEDD